MEASFAELPLVFFTTLAPIGAGAFIALAATLATAEIPNEKAKSFDKFSFIPFIVAAIGFCASMLHLANPLNAVNAIAGLGRSPLTNEVCMGGLFMVVALVYLVLAYTGRIGGKRKTLAIVAAVLAVAFALFVGCAYLLPTVSSWNTPLLPLEILGMAMVGGSALYALVQTLAGVEPAEGSKKSLTAIAAIGGALAVIALLAHLAMVSGMGTAVAQGGQIISTVAPFAIVGIILVAVAAVEVVRGYGQGMTTGIAIRASIEAIVGTFLVRFAFYAMFLSVGVTLM